MKVSAIVRQQKRADRYSIFIDGKYAFSLGESALLESKLATGQELDDTRLKQLISLASEDKLYHQTLRWVAYKPRTSWEVEFYLSRKHSTPEKLKKVILNKLSITGLVDDSQYARSFVNDRNQLKPTSKRKLLMELRRKHISEDVINEAMAERGDDSEEHALISMIERKRRSGGRYKDDLKLMQYLARQGFNYEDIKAAITKAKD